MVFAYLGQGFVDRRGAHFSVNVFQKQFFFVLGAELIKVITLRRPTVNTPPPSAQAKNGSTNKTVWGAEKKEKKARQDTA